MTAGMNGSRILIAVRMFRTHNRIQLSHDYYFRTLFIFIRIRTAAGNCNIALCF